MMNTVEDIFLNLGGTGAVARIIGVKHSAASEMRRRSSIPVKYWPALVDGAKATGAAVDNDILVRLHVEHAGASV